MLVAALVRAAVLAQGGGGDACRAVCVPESAWNGTHCVLGAMGEAREAAGGGWIFLGVVVSILVVIAGSIATETYLPPAEKFPKLMATEDAGSEWRPARATLRRTLGGGGGADYRAVIRKHLPTLLEVTQYDVQKINLLYSARFDRVCAVRDTIPAIEFSMVLFQDGEWLWLPDEALVVPRDVSHAPSAVDDDGGGGGAEVDVASGQQDPPPLALESPAASEAQQDTPLVGRTQAPDPPPRRGPPQPTAQPPLGPPTPMSAAQGAEVPTPADPVEVPTAGPAVASPAPASTPSRGAAVPLYPPVNATPLPVAAPVRKRLKIADMESDSD